MSRGFSSSPSSNFKFPWILRSATTRSQELIPDPYRSDEHFPGRRAFFERACGTAGFVPVDVTETDSVPLLLAAVAMGAGAGILPSHAKKLPHKACVFIPVTSPVLVSELFLLSQNKETSPEAQALAAALKTCSTRLGREGRR